MILRSQRKADLRGMKYNETMDISNFRCVLMAHSVPNSSSPTLDFDWLRNIPRMRRSFPWNRSVVALRSVVAHLQRSRNTTLQGKLGDLVREQASPCQNSKSIDCTMGSGSDADEGCEDPTAPSSSAEVQLYDVVTPNDNDVLCGRGGEYD